MKKRLTDWMDDLPMQYLDELEQAEKGLQREKKQCVDKESGRECIEKAGQQQYAVRHFWQFF